MPGESLTGNHIGHVSRLHCLYKAMDRETQGQQTERPHSRNSVSTHTARLAASTKTCLKFSTEIPGLQRRTVYGWWFVSERPRLVIPGELQQEYLSCLHKGHLSANRVQENAKEYMYWTGINVDIEDYTKQCQECIKRSQVAKDLLQPHDIPEGPWRKLGMDYFNFDGNSYVIICDYFLKFLFLYRAKTWFWSLKDYLIDLFSIEGYPDQIVSDNGPPFQSKEFAKFLSGLGIKHTTSPPGYPSSNGFIEWHLQIVKNMLSKSSNTQFFQEVLADLRTTYIGMGLPSRAEILHRRNLTTKAQAEIDIKGICSVLQERQLKMMLTHHLSRWAKKARLLVVGERCLVLGPGNKWIDTFVTGITGSSRRYDTDVEATGEHLTRNSSHIRPRSTDIPMIHASFL